MKSLKRTIQRWVRRRLRLEERGRVAARPLPLELFDVVKSLPKDHQQAARRLVDIPLLQSKGYRDKVIRTSRERTHPDILRFYRKFNVALQKRGYAFYAHEFRRSFERQRVLRAQGVSKAGPGDSPHNWGCATDIVHASRFWDLTEKEWAVIGAIGKEVARKANINIRWGGDWDSDGVPVHRDPDESFWDPAHWELAEWKEYREAIREIAARGSELETDDTSYWVVVEYEVYLNREARKAARAAV